MYSHTILAIDDAQADCELLRTLLQHRGIAVDVAYTAQKGMEVYDASRHATVVIDWNLPDMSGIEVGKTIRQKFPGALVILVSSLLDKEYAAIASKSGIHHVFEKTMNMDHIDRICALVLATPRRARSAAL
jgi:DNA-binding response OmpR family regulator